MGILDGIIHRIGDTADAGLKAVGDVGNLLLDAAAAPVGGGSWHDFSNDLGQLAEHTVGPQGIIGAPVGGLPEWERIPVRTFNTWDQRLYKDLVARPVSAEMTAASLTDAQNGGWGNPFGSIFGIFDPAIQHQAWQIANHRSPGQAVAYGVLTKDIRAPGQLEKARNSPWFNITSGTTDALLRLRRDPLAMAAGGISSALHGTLGTAPASILDRTLQAENVKSLGGHLGNRVVYSQRLHDLTYHLPFARKIVLSQRDIDTLDAQGAFAQQWERVKAVHAEGATRAEQSRADFDAAKAALKTTGGSIEGLDAPLVNDAAARIRDEMFPNNPEGDRAAQVLADLAKRGDDQLGIRALRVMAGSQTDISALQAQAADAAQVLADAAESRRNLLSLSHQAFHLQNGDDLLAESKAAVSAANADTNITQRALDLRGVTMQSPDQTLVGKLRLGVKNEDWYQNGIFGRALRTVVEKRPYNVVRLDNAGEGDVMVQRWASEAQRLRYMTTGEVSNWRAKFLAAGAPQERQLVLSDFEDQLVRKMGQKYGFTPDEIQTVTETAKRIRLDGAATGNTAFAADEAGNLIYRPVLENQLADTHGLVDVFALDKRLKRVASIRDMKGPSGWLRKAGVGTKDLSPVEMAQVARRYDIPANLVDAFYDVWKPATLFRIGFPVRFTTDFQLREMAMLGVLAPLKHLSRWGARVAHVGEEDAIRGFTSHGVEAEGAFGPTMDNVWKHYASSGSDFQRLVGDETQFIHTGLRRSGTWKSFAPDDHGYAQAWEHAVRNQIGQSKLGKYALQADTPEQVQEWLRTSREAADLRRLFRGQRNLDDIASDAHAMVHRYVPDELVPKALDRTISYKDLEALGPERMPTVHGEVLSQVLNQSAVSHYYNRAIRGLYNAIGKAPADKLSWHPYFADVYANEMHKLTSLVSPDEAITPELVDQLQGRAREVARAETRDLLHVLAERSRTADMVKFVMPFYGAWEQLLTRWARIAVERPKFAIGMMRAFRAPEEAGLVYDGQGNKIDASGKITQAARGGPWKVGDSAADSERHVVFHIAPQIASHLPFGAKGLDRVSFNKDAINMLTSGPPGFGPPVQIPVNQFLLKHPEYADSMKFVLPYGPSSDVIDQMLPTTLRNAYDAHFNTDKHRNLVASLFQQGQVDYSLGKRPDLEAFYTRHLRDEGPVSAGAALWHRMVQEANDQAHKQGVLNLFADFVSPVGATFQSPYQPYIDAMRARRTLDAQMRAANPKIANDPNYQSPDEWFTQTYGEEFFPLTETISRSVNGVPPTLEAWKSYQQHKALIDANPDLGSIITGQAGGEFNRAVYEAQKASGQRKAPSDADLIHSSTAIQWDKYSKAMDVIDGMMHDAGLPNLRVKEAAQLAAVKTVIVQALSAENPEWAKQYLSSSGDPLKFDRMIEGMTAIAHDPQLRGRSDLAGLQQYLKLRDTFRQILDASKFKTLDATENAPLRATWDNVVAQLVLGNPAFATLWHRYLEHDPIRDPVIQTSSALPAAETLPTTQAVA